MSKRPPRPTERQLEEALALPDTPDNSVKRRDVFWAFEQYEPELSQIPFTRKAVKRSKLKPILD